MNDDEHLIAAMSDLIDLSKRAPAGKEILAQCLEIAALLLDKNISYGNSALDPIKIFASDIDAGKQIDIKIDDKLSRIKRGNEFQGDDTILDLAGYLVLKLIHDKRVRNIGGLNGTKEKV
jgi:hypothetical protein